MSAQQQTGGATAESTKAGTEYVILAQVAASVTASTYSGPEDITGTWRKVDTITHRTSEAAIRAYAETSGEAGVYVAIPARSWAPVKVAVKTETKLEVSAA